MCLHISTPANELGIILNFKNKIMKKFKYITAIMLFISLFIVSCEKDDADTVKPVITITGPEDDEAIFIGSEIHFEVDFSDDTELKSYKVDIHSNTDGHSHKAVTTNDSVAFTFQKSWEFEPGLKNAKINHYEIEIPVLIDGKPILEGHYHFLVYCTDVAGNESWTATEVEILKSPSMKGNIAISNKYPIKIK